jgi:hypothetical protein
MGKTAEELRVDIVQQRAELTRDFDQIGDRVSPGRMIERRTEAAKGRMRRVREAVMGSAHGVQGGASHVSDSVGGAASKVAHAPSQVEEQTRGNPLAAGAVAFGLGLLAATVLPPTRREQEAARRLEPQLETVAHSAGEAGRAMAEELEPAVREAGASVADTARTAVDDVKQTARDEGRSAAQTAKETGGGAMGHGSR